ncbi:NUDIX domain-containing protein [Bacillus kwashiorkori]|uniref:NUDIX domain-containing protein n=1 Tax=Bacillus kwashiorkori TaxID=1522318 RepID=UPI000782BC86|nr:NUDIX hydrolase [Bacillus kwashiorkori]
MKLYEEKTVKRESIFNGRMISLHVDEVLLPNGHKSTREVVLHPGAVGIIALTEEGKIVLVEQFRKPLERSLVEIPAGKMDAGEDSETTAKRELEEETGYACKSLNHIASFYTSPGFSNEIIHLYVAEGLTKENRLSLDEDEFVNVIEVTYEEALQLVKEQQIFDAKTIYAVQYWQLLKVMGK